MTETKDTGHGSGKTAPPQQQEAQSDQGFHQLILPQGHKQIILSLPYYGRQSTWGSFDAGS